MRCSCAARVLSRAVPDRAVVDAGLKASSIDSGMPVVWQRPELRYVKAADDHGVLEMPAECVRWRSARCCCWCPAIATPPSTCTTRSSASAAAHVEALWPVAARGALL